MLQVFADLQVASGRENGHLLEWASGNATDFYKLTSRMLPLQVAGGDGGPAITRIARERGRLSVAHVKLPPNPIPLFDGPARYCGAWGGAVPRQEPRLRQDECRLRPPSLRSGTPLSLPIGRTRFPAD